MLQKHISNIHFLYEDSLDNELYVACWFCLEMNTCCLSAVCYFMERKQGTDYTTCTKIDIYFI